MKATEWFELPNNDTSWRGRETKEVSIRGWQAGDGLLCSHAGMQRKFPCGKPVAVVRRVTERETKSHVERVSLRVVCTHHVADVVRQTVGESGWHNVGSAAVIEKEAREEVLVNHWDEYQALLLAKAESIHESYLSMIPESLREYFKEVEAPPTERN